MTRTGAARREILGSRLVKGFTLIEVIFAMGIFVTGLLWTLSTLMNAIETNRILTASITANAAILHKREEIQEIAQASADVDGPAASVIKYYASLAVIGSSDGENGLPVGPNGSRIPVLRWSDAADGDRGLIHTFAIPGPAESVSTDTPFNRGYGEVIFYLNETAVPVDSDTNSFWTDLGDGASGYSGTAAGYDINGNGSIENNLTSGAKAALAGGNYETLINAVEPFRLPIDITVRYFATAEHRRNYVDTTRRTVITGLRTPGSEVSFK